MTNQIFPGFWEGIASAIILVIIANVAGWLLGDEMAQTVYAFFVGLLAMDFWITRRKGGAR
jgi:hypothetical protein